jgi:hypothetical protein
MESSSYGLFSSEYLHQHDPHFHRYHSYNVFVGTWNVNAKIEDFSNLPAYLNLDNYIGNTSPEIIVLGFQEVIELNATNTIVASSVQNNLLSLEKRQKWQEMLSEYLAKASASSVEHFSLNIGPAASSDGPSHRISSLESGVGGSYHVLESLSMVGIWLIIFVKKFLLSSITNLQAKCIPRGIGGLFGNKGGVCIRMTIHDTSVCFISAHLTANREELLKRNDDYHQIMKKKIFTKPSAEYMMQLQEETTVSASHTKILAQINEMKDQLVHCLQDIQAASNSDGSGLTPPPLCPVS